MSPTSQGPDVYFATMIGVLLLLQSSMLVRPTYMSAEPPEARALRAIRIVHKDVPGVPMNVERTREQAEELALEIHGQLLGGEDFGELARLHSAHESARNEGNWGTTWPGILPEPLDEFLYAAEVGDVSEPMDLSMGFHIVKRIERDAAWRLIRIDGVDGAARTRCQALIERLRSGEDFAELAKTESNDPITAPRGGVVGIFERHRRDASIRKEAFGMEVGELRGPIETPFALFIVEKLPVADVDPALREDTCARVRAILVQFQGAQGAPFDMERTEKAAGLLTVALMEEIQAGREMSELARVHTDDPGGREHGGDLGWIRRASSDFPQFVDQVFLKPKGELIGPIRSNAGWVILRREQ